MHWPDRRCAPAARRHVRPGDVKIGHQQRPHRRRAGRPIGQSDIGFAHDRVGDRGPVAPAEQGQAERNQKQQKASYVHAACVAPYLAKEKPGHARFLPAARRARLHPLAHRQAEADRRLSEAHARSRPRLCAGGADRGAEPAGGEARGDPGDRRGAGRSGPALHEPGLCRRHGRDGVIALAQGDEQPADLDDGTLRLVERGRAARRARAGRGAGGACRACSTISTPAAASPC